MDNAPNWFRSSTTITSPTTPQTPTSTPAAADSSIPSPSTPSSSSMTKAEGLFKMEEITRKVNRKIARKEARISKNAGSDTNSPASTVTTPAAKNKSKSSSRRRTRDEHHDRLARGDSPPGHPHSAPPRPRPPPPPQYQHHSSSSSSTPAPPGYDPLYDVHQSQYPPYQPHPYQPHLYPPYQYQDQPQQQPTTVPRPQASHLPREEDTVWFLCGHLLDVGKAIGTAFVCMFRCWWWLVRSDWKFLSWLWCQWMSEKDDLRSDHLGRGGGGRHDGWSDGNDGRGRHDGGRTEEEKEKRKKAEDHGGWLKRCSQVYEAVWQRKEPQLNHYTPTKVIMSSSSSTRTLPQEPPQAPRNTSPQSQEATPLFMPPQYQQHTNSGTLRQRIHTPSAMAHTPDPAYAPPPPAQPPSTPAPLRRRRLSSCTRILVGTGILIPISIFIILLSLFLPPPTPHNPHLPIDNLLSAISHTSTALELLTETANRRSDSNVFACGMIETAAETIAEPRTHAPIRRAFRALADEGGWACPDTLNYTKAKPVDVTLTNLGVALAEELWTMTTLLNRSVITSQELAAESEHIAARIRKAAPRSELCRVVPLQSHAIAVSPRPQTSWMTTFLPWTTPSPPTSFSSSSPPIHDSAALNYELDYLNITLSPAVASQAHTFAQLEKVGRQCLQRWNAWTAYVPLERLSPERGLYTMQNIEALCREFVREEDVPLPDEAVGGHANHPSSSSSSPNEIMHELTEKVVGAQKRKSSSLPLNVRAQEAFERARRRLLEVEEEEEGERHRQMEPVEEEEEEARRRALGGGMQSHGFNWLAPSPHREKSAAGGWWLCLWRWLIDRIDWRQSQTGSTAAAAKRRDAATRRRRCRVLGVEEDMSKKKKQESRGGYDYDYHHDGDDDDDDDDVDDDGHGPVETLQVTCRRWSLCARQAGQFRRVGGGGSTATDRAAAAAAAAG